MSITTDSDYDLTRKSAQGDITAFEEIHSRHYRRVFSICLRMLHNPSEAEDLTQDVFIQLFRKVKTFRGDSAFTTWLHRMTVNQVLMYFRKSTVKFEKTTEDGYIPEQVVTGSINPNRMRIVDKIALNNAIKQLPKGYKNVFTLHDIKGFDHQEVSRILGCSTGTSKSQLHKARLKLRKLLLQVENPKIYIKWEGQEMITEQHNGLHNNAGTIYDWVLQYYNPVNDWSSELDRLFAFMRHQNVFPEIDRERLESVVIACFTRMQKKPREALTVLVRRHMTNEPVNKQTIRIQSIVNRYGFKTSDTNGILAILQGLASRGCGKISPQKLAELEKTFDPPQPAKLFEGLKPAVSSVVAPLPQPVRKQVVSVDSVPVSSAPVSSAPVSSDVKSDKVAINAVGSGKLTGQQAVNNYFAMRFSGQAVPKRLMGNERDGLLKYLADHNVRCSDNSLPGYISLARQKHAFALTVTITKPGSPVKPPVTSPVITEKRCSVQAVVTDFLAEWFAEEEIPNRLEGVARDALLKHLESQGVSYTRGSLSAYICNARKSHKLVPSVVLRPKHETSAAVAPSSPQPDRKQVEKKVPLQPELPAQPAQPARPTQQKGMRKKVEEFLAEAYQDKIIPVHLMSQDMNALVLQLEERGIICSSTHLGSLIHKYRDAHNANLGVYLPVQRANDESEPIQMSTSFYAEESEQLEPAVFATQLFASAVGSANGNGKDLAAVRARIHKRALVYTLLDQNPDTVDVLLQLAEIDPDLEVLSSGL